MQTRLLYISRHFSLKKPNQIGLVPQKLPNLANR